MPRQTKRRRMAGPQAGDGRGGRAPFVLSAFLRSGCPCGGCGGRLCLLYPRLASPTAIQPSQRPFNPHVFDGILFVVCYTPLCILEIDLAALLCKTSALRRRFGSFLPPCPLSPCLRCSCPLRHLLCGSPFLHNFGSVSPAATLMDSPRNVKQKTCAMAKSFRCNNIQKT